MKKLKTIFITLIFVNIIANIIIPLVRYNWAFMHIAGIIKNESCIKAADKEGLGCYDPRAWGEIVTSLIPITIAVIYTLIIVVLWKKAHDDKRKKLLLIYLVGIVFIFFLLVLLKWINEGSYGVNQVAM